MAKQNLFTSLHVDYNSVVNSKRWFNEQVNSMKKGQLTTNRVLSRSNGILTFRVQPGSLYFFKYDPKLKESLPYYDTFPLVIPYKSVPGGMLGLNLHYLDYQKRFILFKKLFEIANTEIDDTSKIRYSWSMASKFAGSFGVEHCIKHYLNDHVASPFMKVQPDDWTTAIMLPISRFEKKTEAYVWSHQGR